LPSWGVAGLVALMSGCSGQSAGTPEAEITDSAGTRIVVYDLTGVVTPTYATVGEHDLQIGALDGPQEYTFSSITSVRTAHDGSILVTDGGVGEVRVYGASGVHASSFGQRGEGPGEFAASPSIVGLVGDTMFAWDSRSRRVTTLSLPGDLIDMVTLQAGSAGRPTRVIRLDDGTYLSQSRWIAPGAVSGGAHDLLLELDSLTIERIDAEGELIDTVRVLADVHRVKRSQVEGNLFRTQMMSQPLSSQALMRSDGMRPILGHSSSVEVISYTEAGAPETILRVVGAWPTLTTREIRSRIEAQLVEASEDGQLDPALRRVYDDFLPDRTPAFSNFIVTSDHDIWVSQYELDLSSGFEWLVFSPEGEFRGSVHTPPDLRVFEIGSEFVAGVVRDDFDVQYVRRYPLLLGRD
jgi:hypothetical protein